MTRTRIAAVVTALALGVAPISSAMAYSSGSVRAPAYSYGLGVHDGPFYERCSMSSAAEGNANQQTRPVKQYGQTSGGTRC